MQVDHNDTRAFSRTPVDEVSARRIDLYLAANITYTRHISMPLARFEPVIPGSESPQTHCLTPRGHRVGQRKL